MPLQPIFFDFPLAKWGLDFIDPINPPSSIGHIFILTTIDYFTKWIEVVPLKNAHDEQVINLLESNIFARFGILLERISDNGSTFIFAKFARFLSEFVVKHFTSSTYYPQGNGQAESTNKNMVKILKRIIDDKPRQWHTLLTYALSVDRATAKNNVGHTPFSLSYGQEVVMPVELQLTSLCLAMQAKELTSIDISHRMSALLALEEQRNHALENLKKRQ
jgi:transposase InsO family protein